VRRLAEELATSRRTSGIRVRAADEHDLVDLRRLEAGVGERLPARLQRAIHGRPDQRLEFGARDGPAVGADANFGVFVLGEIPLRLNDRFADALNLFGAERGAPGAADARMSARTRSVNSRSRSSPPRCVSPLVESTWNTPSSTRRIEMSNVPPAQSYTAMMPVLTLVEAIGERRGGRLVDHAQHVEAAMRPASRVAVRCASLK